MNKLVTIGIFIIFCFCFFACEKTVVKERKEVYTSSSEIELARHINMPVPVDTIYFEISELDTYNEGKKRGLIALSKYTDANYEKVKEKITKAEKLENVYVYKDVFERNKLPKEVLSKCPVKDGEYHLLASYEPYFYLKEGSIFQKGFCFLGEEQYVLVSLIEN